MAELILSNARIVLEDGILHGSVVMRDGRIAAIDEGPSRVGEDLGGDYLVPGLVELHTDHLEAHYSPRPGVRWDKTSAIQAHDAQVVTSGITTVFDCLRMGSDEDGGFDKGEMRDMADAIQAAEKDDRLRADHLIHLRCEVASDNVLDHFAACPPRLADGSFPGPATVPDDGSVHALLQEQAGPDRCCLRPFRRKPACTFGEILRHPSRHTGPRLRGARDHGCKP
jgi:hypothetical protein